MLVGQLKTRRKRMGVLGIDALFGEVKEYRGEMGESKDMQSTPYHVLTSLLCFLIWVMKRSPKRLRIYKAKHPLCGSLPPSMKLWEPKERTHNLETKSVCGGRQVGEVGYDRGLYRLAGVR